MFALLLFILGYVWGKLVERSGSWMGAAAAATALIRDVLTGITTRFTSPNP